MLKLQSRRLAPILSIGAALLIGGIFKVFAFAREAFIAAHFGFSSVTDAYFSLQQFPLTLATFMFGAFALAFVPAYAESNQMGAPIRWLPGVLAAGTGFGLLATMLTAISAKPVLGMFIAGPVAPAIPTLMTLALCYVPIIYIGLWAGICTSRGNSTQAMIVMGLPYLMMTVTLVLMYLGPGVNALSLPLSMTIGFGLVGSACAIALLVKDRPRFSGGVFRDCWRAPEFRKFLSQLGASASENAGYSANWLLTLHFLSQAAARAVSANNCAMRLAMLGYSLLTLPAMQLLQARISVTRSRAQKRKTFVQFLGGLGAVSILIAILACAFRLPVIQLVYMRGKFSMDDRDAVAALIPAWACYFVVLSLNAAAARFLYGKSPGRGVYQKPSRGLHSR